MILRAREMSVGYADRTTRTHVLGPVDLCAHPGHLVCLLGRNGTGKSTLLRTLAGMQRPLAGTVELTGRPMGRMTRTEVATALGVVLTDRTAVGAMTARRLVELGRYPHLGWSGRLAPADRAVVDGALEAVGAGALAERDTAELSDGERQRVMIARALAQDPRVLLLDEPTAFLDLPARVEVMALLRTLARDRGLAVVVSSHDLDLALRLADVLWLVDEGGAVHVGSPAELIGDGRLVTAFSSDRTAGGTADLVQAVLAGCTVPHG